MGANIYKNKKPLIIFLVPTFVFMVVYLYFPFLMNIWNSFQDVEILGSKGKGFLNPWYGNYVHMFQDRVVGIALKNTLILLIVTLVVQVGLAVILALIVDNIRHGKSFFKTVYFFPTIISATAIGLLFNLIFLYDKGLVNQVLAFFGNTEPKDWKAEGIAVFTMMVPIVWQYVGFYFIIVSTGLSSIPEQLYESARIDGASKWQCVKYISLPLIRNVIYTCGILAVTASLKVFDLPWTMFPKGMPLDSTFLTGTYMYFETMEVKNVDYGSALAVLIVVLGLALTKIIRVVLKGKED